MCILIVEVRTIAVYVYVVSVCVFIIAQVWSAALRSSLCWALQTHTHTHSSRLSGAPFHAPTVTHTGTAERTQNKVTPSAAIQAGTFTFLLFSAHIFTYFTVKWRFSQRCAQSVCQVTVTETGTVAFVMMSHWRYSDLNPDRNIHIYTECIMSNIICSK